MPQGSNAQKTHLVLSSARTITTTVAVFRSSSPADRVLQQNTNRVSSVNWSNVTSGIADAGTIQKLLLNPPVGTRFYRLVKP